MDNGVAVVVLIAICAGVFGYVIGGGTKNDEVRFQCTHAGKYYGGHGYWIECKTLPKMIDK